MGFDPETVDRMSFWKFLAAQGGFQGGSADTGLSDQEVDDLWESVKP